MKKAELKKLKEQVVSVVRELPYGSYETTSRIVSRLTDYNSLDTDELFELEEAVYSLDESNEMVLDKFEHFNLIQGLPFNLDFIKLKNKGVPDNCCAKIDFSYISGNFRTMIEGCIDLRTGRIVVSETESGPKIEEISELKRKALAKKFIKDDFLEEEREIKVDEDYVIADGSKWEVSIYDSNYDSHSIYGIVSSVDDIPMEGAKEVITLALKVLKK